jgi:hypothetical protein
MNTMYVESPKKSIKRFYHLLIKRHIFGITSPLRVLPDFLVIGAGRTGTTSLYYYLDQHPSIVKSAYDEIGFFDDNFHLGLSWYHSMFPTIFTKFLTKFRTKKFMTYEVTPQYIRRPWTSKRIKKTLPGIKLIIILRNPVDRTYSHYHLSRQYGEKRDFRTVIEEDIKNISEWNIKENNDSYFANQVENSKLARGFYYEQIIKWFNIFPKEQIMIIPSEDLASETQRVLREIFYFLGLPAYNIKNTEKVNVSKYSKMDQDTRQLLIDFFRPYNEKLFGYLNQKFDWDK